MISKEKVVLWLADIELFYWEEGKTENDLYQSEMAHKAIELLKSQPDVVRCKDCKWWERKDKGCNYGYCHACKHGHYSDHWEIQIYRTYREDWFCADGEKRSD